MRSLLRLTLAVCVLPVMACDTAPFAPEPVEPDFLIGDSPLQPITLDKTNDPPELNVTVMVNRGLTQVRIEDKFFVRFTGEIQLPDGTTVGSVDPQDIGLTGQKDTGVRDGSDVALAGCIQIPAPVWDAIKDLKEVDVVLLAQLVTTTGSGEKVLDSVTLTGTIDPQGGPAPQPDGQ